MREVLALHAGVLPLQVSVPGCSPQQKIYTRRPGRGIVGVRVADQKCPGSRQPQRAITDSIGLDLLVGAPCTSLKQDASPERPEYPRFHPAGSQ